MFLSIVFRPKVSAESRHFSPKVSVSAESQNSTFGRTLMQIEDVTFVRNVCPLCNVSSNSYCMQNFFPRFSRGESVNKVT